MGRAIRIVLVVLAGIVAIASMALAGVVLFLHTASGARFIRRRVVDALNGTIAGRVAVGTLRFRDDRVFLRDLRVYDPRGNLVASVDRVGVAFRVLPLLRRRIEVPEVDLENPLLRLAPAANRQELDLSRALARRASGATGPAGKRSRWSIRIGHLGITGGAISYWRDPLPTRGAAPAVRACALRVSGTAKLDGGSRHFAVRVRTTGRVEGLVSGPLVIDAGAQGQAQVERAHIRVAIAQMLRGEARLEGPRRGVIDIERLRIDPAVARALRPSYPVHVPIEAQLRAHFAPGVVAGSASIQATGGVLRVEGSVDPQALTTADGVRITGDHLDIGKLLGDPADRAPVELRVEVSPGGLRPPALTASARISVPRGRVNGQTIGPVRFRARVDEGRIEALHLYARAPGARIAASARGPLDAVTGHGTLSARVGRAGRAFAKIIGRSAPALSGQVRLTAEATGSLAPGDLGFAHLSFRADAPKLQLGGTSLGGVRVAGRLGAARAGGWQPVALSAELAQPAQVSLSASGELAGDRHSALLRRISLCYPGARWMGTEAARLSVHGDRQAVHHLRLADGSQKIALDLTHAGRRIDGHLVLDDVRFRSLPHGPGPARGALSGHFAMTGTLAEPSIDVDLHARDVSARAGVLLPAAAGQGRVAVGTVDVRFGYARQHADLSVSIGGAAGGDLQARAKVPVDLGWPAARELAGGAWKRLPVRGSLVGNDFETAWLAKLVPSVARLSGRIDADARVSGQLGDPQLMGQVSWQQGRIVVKPPRFARSGTERQRQRGGARESGAAPRARKIRSGSSPSRSTVP